MTGNHRQVCPQARRGLRASAQVGAGPPPVEAHLPQHEPGARALVLRV